MPPSSMNDLFAFLTALMTEHAGMFEALGFNLFRSFAIILIAWYGIKGALASAGGGHGPLFHFDQFAALLLTIAFGFGMITYYSNPIPGFGVSFHHLIVDQALDLANQLNHQLVTELWERLSSLYFGLETPGWTIALNALEAVRYVVTVLAILIAQGAVFAVIAFGYIAVSIAVLLGPVFIPFFIVPHNGVAVLGLVQVAFPVRLLSRRRQRLSVRLRQSADPLPRRPSASLHRRQFGRDVLPAAVHADRLHLRHLTDSFARQLDVYRSLGRVGGAQHLKVNP